MQTTTANTGEAELAGNDLGPLAWVLEELKKSLDGATKAMRRFVRDAELARGSDLAALDASQLRIARQQLHQAVGALEMVGFSAPAKVMRAMEALAQKFVQRPELCSDDAASKMERASFALAEYLEGVLKGRTASAVALFPQYRDVLDMVGGEKVHPSDLWPIEWSWNESTFPFQVAPLALDPSIRAQLDQHVLKLVKTNDVNAAAHLRGLSLGLAAGQSALQPKVFWQICAAFFEANVVGLCAGDVYAKRGASRVLLQYASLARGDQSVSDRLAQDLLFFCAQAVPAKAADAPVLVAVRRAYHLTNEVAVNYDTPQFGRFDPALLVQARKRIATATETWSALAGGDTNRLKLVGDQFGAVTDSILKLHPESNDLARALMRSVEATARSGEPPTTPVAMEVATAILYLEAAYEDMDPTDSQMTQRSVRLAQRLEQVTAGGQSEPLEGWMEDLYRRVSDRQTMGSVVSELRTSLGEVEKSLDQFFRNPVDKVPLHEVPSQLAQMRGVFSVLGLDQASVAMLRMRDTVEKLLVDNIVPGPGAVASFEKLGNSIGALGFLIDMLGYQRSMAKKLFVYDDEDGEFKPVMGRAKEPMEKPKAPPALHFPLPEQQIESTAKIVSAFAPLVVELPPADMLDLPSVAPFLVPALAATVAVGAAMVVPKLPAQVPPSVAVAPATALDDDDAEIRDIFLEEANEVVQGAMLAVAKLENDPSNLGEQTTLRRAFHTLKGSSRMVGLNDFGEAAWSMEQLLNAWLAEQKPASSALTALSSRAIEGFGAWVNDISARTDGLWSAQSFRQAADALRLENRLIDLDLPGMTKPEVVKALDVIAEVQPTEAAPTKLPQFAEAQPTEVSESVLDFGVSVRPDFEATSIFARLPGESLDQFGKAKAAKGEAQSSNLGLEDFDFTPEPKPPEFEATSFFNSELGTPSDAVPLEFAASRLDIVFADSHQSVPPIPEGSLDTIPSELPIFEDSKAGVEELDDSVKIIGTLRIGIPLYNVYLNEADEWSRRLLTELNEWSLELHRPLPDTAVALAHSLAGSSATVGFTALSDIARALESALQHVQLHGQGDPAYAQVFVDAAEEIRRLLHQFAAGFLKEPDEYLIDGLNAIVEIEFKASRDGYLDEQDFELPPETRPAGLDDSDLTPEEIALVDFKPSAVSAVQQGLEAQASALHDLPFEPSNLDFTEVAKATPQTVTDQTALGGISAGVPTGGLVAAAAVSAFVATPSFALPAATLNIAQPQAILSAVDDDIDLTDALDADLFPIFEEEALELLPQLGGAARQWTDRPDNLSARSEVLRVLHTLKGSARLAGAMRLGEMTHRMESAIEQLGTESLQTMQLEPLLTRFDAILKNFDSLRHGSNAAFSLPEVAKASTAIASDSPLATASAASLADGALGAAAGPTAIPAQSPSTALPTTTLKVAAQLTPTAPLRQGSNQSVRVRSHLLDRLVNQAGEVMITRSRLEARLDQMRSSMVDLSGNLDRLRHHLRDIEVQSESQMQSRMALAKETAQQFDPLEFDRFTRVQELTRMMAESVNDVATVQRNLQRTVEGTEDDLIAQGRQARGLQRDLLRTRMVEFESISERLYGVVRQAAKETGKQVKLDITGGSLDIDRGVLERMAPAFEHLLRNSVAHGIESADTRAAAHKPPVGSITIDLQHQANEVSVTFLDDGAGLDLIRIRDKAVSSGVALDAQNLSDADAANLIFLPGFSTATSITEISGRGIGMDVVRTEMNALGGRIETTTERGKGTRFNLVVPLTTAVTQVVMLRCGELVVGVPANLIEIVRRVPAADVERAYQSETFEHAGKTFPFYWAGALLQASSHSNEMITKNLPVAVFRSAGQFVAMHVDEVLGNQEVVVKNLGPQLSRLPGLTGMSVVASGAVILIYNPVALASVYGEQARALRSAALRAVGSQSDGSLNQATPNLLASVTQVPLVMVVDDSITVRRVTQRLLKREGYRVVMAADGLQALERLMEEKPTLVLSDIEMPRMDGFDLARNIRADANLRDLPIIMITSRIAEKHREHARELGVDHYLGKPYSEDELLRLVRQYCMAAQDV